MDELLARLALWVYDHATLCAAALIAGSALLIILALIFA